MTVEIFQGIEESLNHLSSFGFRHSPDGTNTKINLARLNVLALEALGTHFGIEFSKPTAEMNVREMLGVFSCVMEKAQVRLYFPGVFEMAKVGNHGDKPWTTHLPFVTDSMRMARNILSAAEKIDMH